MKKFILLTLLSLLCVGPLSAQAAKSSAPAVGQAAPAFTLPTYP